MPDVLPLEIDVRSVAALQEKGAELALLDCREPGEHQLGVIAGAILIPMRTIPGRVEELAEFRDRRMVVYCHHGGRSMQVTQWLRAQGFERAQSMAGGIDEWSQAIDPSLPRY